MIRNSLVVKLWLTIIVMVAVVLSLLTVFLEQVFDTYFYSSQEQALRDRAAYISNILVTQTDKELALTIAEEVTKVSNSHMFVVGSLAKGGDDHVLDTVPADMRPELSSGKQIIRRGLSPGFGNFRADSTSAWVIHPISENGKLHALLLIYQPVTEIEHAINRIRNLILFAAGIGVVLATGLSFVVSKNLSRPVIQMTQVAEQMALGNFEGKVNVVTGDEVGRLGHTINFLADSLQQTIHNLSKEKEQMSGILLSMHDGVVAADRQGKITLANGPAKNWMSAVRLEETDVPDHDLLPSELNDLKNWVLEDPKTKTAEFIWQGRTIAVTMTPLHEPGNGVVRGVVAVLRDMTEERRLDRIRKDFVASVSHELRTPLAMIQGYGEALLDEFGEDPEQRMELTQIILDEANRMKRLVNDLLDLAQLEAGQFELHTTELNLSNLINWVGRKFHTLAHDQGIGFSVDYDENANYQVEGDSDRLEQVFTNLVDNAMRHTPANGSVSLRLFTNGNFVYVEVSDTGEGIPEEDLPFIFERFYKVDKARTRSKGGTGLGLSIARNIVLKHHGNIKVTSTVGKGTTFTVMLPMRVNEENSF
ncbi:ATP-binding protein [Effusibacillus dendaii]|uniref:histidine kinase n=1 Tax=Effusibacillus dendaii TaxID=2743772 RepID=A0A7I8DB92_9BACL|nr:ATP-binding protein [Effusibacillus dendaii]BCJ85780.1 sensor histidine kinase [Effusibacillus dendaii]